MEITELYERLLARKSPACLISALAYDPDSQLIMHADGCLGFVIRCYPLLGVDERIVQQLQPLLSLPYPTNTILQVSLWTSPDVEDQLLAMHEVRTPRPGVVMSNGRRIASALVLSRGEYLRRHTQCPISDLAPTRIRDIQVLVSVKVPFAGDAPNESECDLLGRLRTGCEQILRTVGMAPLTLDPERYLRVLGALLNWDSNASWRSQARLYDDSRLIRDQAFDAETTVKVDEGGIWLGRKRVRTLCVKRLPEYAHLVQAAQFLGDVKTGTRGVRESVLITLHVLFPEAESARTTMTTRKNAATWQSMGPLARYLPRLARQKEDYDTLFQALEDGDRVVRAYLSWSLFSDSDEESEAAVTNLMTYMRELGYRLQEDRYISLPVFLMALPGNADPSAARNLMRFRTMATRHATQLMPVVGDWKGTGTPVMTMMSRNGQLMGLDLFDSPTNYNGVIAAESGSGKSFFCNYLVQSYLSMGADVFVIEIGRSFKNLCKVHGGEHLEFTADSELSLNPFSGIEDFEEQGDFLMATLVAMASPRGEITEFQESALRSVVRTKWDQHGKALTIDLLAESLSKFRDGDGKLDSRVNDLGTQLFAFTSRGEYGKWFNKTSTVNFNSPFTVLELEEIKSRRHLMKVVLVQLMAAIARAMYLTQDGRPKILIIEEAFDLISEGSEGIFIERGFRRFRKYQAAALVILQSVNDLYRTEPGGAIWENAAHKFLLGQTPESIDWLIKSGRLSVGAGAADVLKSVRTEKGLYSEIFVYTRHGSGIARFTVDRFSQLLYSTDPHERFAIAERMTAGMTLEDAIADIIRDEQQVRRRRGH